MEAHFTLSYIKRRNQRENRFVTRSTGTGHDWLSSVRIPTRYIYITKLSSTCAADVPSAYISLYLMPFTHMSNSCRRDWDYVFISIIVSHLK